MSKGYNFPTVGPEWVSNLFYASLSAFIRLVEIFYSMVDTLWSITHPGATDEP